MCNAASFNKGFLTCRYTLILLSEFRYKIYSGFLKFLVLINVF